GCLDLAGKLHATRRGPDDHHAAIRQAIGIPVLRGREAGHPGGQSGTEWWDRRKVASATCYHELAAAPWTLTGRDLVASILRPYSRHASSSNDWNERKFGISLQEADDFWHRHEAVRIIAGVGVPRQATLPIRRQKAKRVPPLRPP